MLLLRIRVVWVHERLWTIQGICVNLIKLIRLYKNFGTARLPTLAICVNILATTNTEMTATTSSQRGPRRSLSRDRTTPSEDRLTNSLNRIEQGTKHAPSRSPMNTQVENASQLPKVARINKSYTTQLPQ